MAKRASGDKSAAWLPGVCGQTYPGQTLHPQTGGLLSGDTPRVRRPGWQRRWLQAGARQSPVGKAGRKDTFLGSLGRAASPLPRETAVNRDSLGRCPPNGSCDQSCSTVEAPSFSPTLSPHCSSKIPAFTGREAEAQGSVLVKGHSRPEPESRHEDSSALSPHLRVGLALSDSHHNSVKRRNKNGNRTQGLRALPEVIRPTCHWAQQHPAGSFLPPRPQVSPTRLL